MDMNREGLCQVAAADTDDSGHPYAAQRSAVVAAHLSQP
jgi:hypothetical protein